MPLYRVLRKSHFPDVGIVEAGTEIDWEGPPGSNLEPIDQAAKKAVATLAKKATAGAAPGDEATAKALAEAVTANADLQRQIALLTQENESLKATLAGARKGDGDKKA